MPEHSAIRRRLTRRRFLGYALTGLAAVTSGCGSHERQGEVESKDLTASVQATPAPLPGDQVETMVGPSAESVVTATPVAEPATLPTIAVSLAVAGLLAARPSTSAQGTEVVPGVQLLGLSRDRDAFLYVPVDYTANMPASLVLLLHGAGGVAEHGLSLLQGLADEANLLLVAPSSRRQTWDVIYDAYGPDVTHINQALEHLFSRFAVDTHRVAIGGFSDGASYALSLGLTNGDLFTHIIAFSPGFMAPAREVGTPRIYISHGMRDTVLPIDVCSRKIVPRLQGAGYDVRYDEFDGPHTVPPEIAREAVAWFNPTDG